MHSIFLVCGELFFFLQTKIQGKIEYYSVSSLSDNEKKQVFNFFGNEIDLKEVRWLTITPENFQEQFKVIEEQEGELVFLAMTIPDYEVMAYNMQELKRYITELKDVVVYYRTVTTEDVSVSKEPN